MLVNIFQCIGKPPPSTKEELSSPNGNSAAVENPDLNDNLSNFISTGKKHIFIFLILSKFFWGRIEHIFYSYEYYQALRKILLGIAKQPLRNFPLKVLTSAMISWCKCYFLHEYICIQLEKYFICLMILPKALFYIYISRMICRL